MSFAVAQGASAAAFMKRTLAHAAASRTLAVGSLLDFSSVASHSPTPLSSSIQQAATTEGGSGASSFRGEISAALTRSRSLQLSNTHAAVSWTHAHVRAAQSFCTASTPTELEEEREKGEEVADQSEGPGPGLGLESVAHTGNYGNGEEEGGEEHEDEDEDEKEIRLETNKVFINNLPYRTTEAELKDFLSREGNVLDVRLHYRLLQDGQKQSRGYGLVMFETCEEAHKVIDALDGVTYKGRTLHLRVDNASKMNSDEEAKRNVDKKVFVDYLHPSLTWQDVKGHFQQSGNVCFVRLLWDRTRNHRQAVVEFLLAEEAQDAILELDNSVLQDNTLHVRAYSQEDMKPKEPLGKSVFVNYIHPDINLKDLNYIFNQVVKVEHSKIFVHRSENYKQAIVTLESTKDARTAIMHFGGTALNGQKIRVRSFIDDENNVRSKWLAGQFREQKVTRGNSGIKLFLDHLNPRAEWQEVKDHLRQAGEIIHVRVMWARNGDHKQAVAEVETEECMERILEDLKGTKILGQPFLMKPYREIMESGSMEIAQEKSHQEQLLASEGEQQSSAGNGDGDGTAAEAEAEAEAEAGDFQDSSVESQGSVEEPLVEEEHVFNWGEGVDNLEEEVEANKKTEDLKLF